MGYTEQLIGSVIFETETNLTATDLKFQSFWSAAGSSFPSPVTHGDYYGISVGGNLPLGVGVVVPGDFIFYSSTKGWSKGAVVKIGVSQINGKTGYVTLNTDDLTDIGYSHKFITQAEKDKLSAIESGAQVNDNALQIKTKYESNADTNAFTDANLTKLNGIEDLADVNVIETVKLNGVALPVNSKEVNIVIGSVFNIKGSVPTYSALPSSGQVDGDTYQVIDTGLSYYWLDTDWESMGGTIDLSNYYTKTETYSKSEVDTALSNKVDKAVGKQLSTEDYTSTEKTKLAGIEDGSQVNDYKLKVSNTDVLQGSLSDKLVAGTNVTLTVLNPGANEQIQITSTGSGGGGDVASVNGVLPVLGDVTLTKSDIGLANVTNVAQLPYTALDTDNTLAANSDTRVSSQKAIKSYIEGLSAINSNGVFSPPTITDNGDGTVTLGTDGIINFYKDVDGKTAIVKLPVTNGAILTLADQAQNFVYCDYNAGTPTYNTSTNQDIFYADTRLTPVIRITREGTILWLNDYGDYANAQSGKILLKDTIENGFRRNTGLDLTTSSTRQVNISSGTVWFGTNALSLPASISGDVGTKFYEYYKVSNVWTKSANLTEFDSTYYSNGVDKLTLASNQWVCKYIFKNTDSKNEMYYVSGNAYNTRAEAFAEVVPSLPSTLLGHAVFVGKIIIQKSQALGVAYGRNYTGYITNGSVTSHNDFANIQGVGSGVTAGHISDVAQTIYGDKTFAGSTTSNDINLTALTGTNIITDTSVKTTLQNVDNIYTVTKQSTGFTNNDTIDIAYDSTARTITLTGTFEAYFRGKKVAVLTNGWVSSSHTTGLAKYYLYYDGSAFVWSTTVPSDDALRIADVYYNTTEKFAVRRTFGFMQPETRKDLHKNIGLYVASGGTLSGYTVSSNVDTNRRPSIALTEIVDEDLTTLSPAHTSQLYTKMYLTGSGTSNFTLETAEIVPLNGNQPYYNQLVTGTWQQTLLPANNYMSVWLVALPVTSDTNSQKYRYIWVQGQSISSGLSTIQGKTPADVNLGTLPSMTSEYVFLAKVIIQYVSGNWIIVQVDALKGNRFSQTMITGSSSSGGAVSVDSTISGNGTIEAPLSISAHTTNTSNPHLVTKTQIGLGNVTDDAQIKKINSSINDNVVTFGATTGDIVKDSGKSINNIAFKNESNTFTADVTIGGTLQVNGNIVQNGASYETHAEQVYTKDNTIILRDGAVAGLGAGEYAGFTAKIYDGTNDGQLVFNKDGIARVGDIGNTQPIATREETPSNGNVAIWDSTSSKFITSTGNTGTGSIVRANSPTFTGTVNGITSTHVGLGNVTNNAQVKKIASSTDNAIMRWDGTTGDLPQNSLVTISDTGTVNVPTGQNYNINGVPLKDISETLTNKTLTAPVLNTEITGTGVTTTGEASKLIKVNSSGRVVLGDTNDYGNKVQVTGRIAIQASTENSPSSGTSLQLYQNAVGGYADIFSYNFTSSTPTPLVLQRPGGNVYLGITADDSSSARLQVNGHLSLSSTINGVGSTARNKFFHLTSAAGNYRQGSEIASVSTGTYTFGLGDTYNADLVFSTMYQNSLNEVLRLKSDKTVQLSSLAGTGNRSIVCDSSGKVASHCYDYKISIKTSSLGVPIDTGLTVNGGNRGMVYMLYYSSQWDAGNETFAGIYMLRCGYDGNNYNISIISENGNSTFAPVFSQSGGTLWVASNPCGISLRAIANK